MKFVVDMNLSPEWVKVLRDAGFELSNSGNHRFAEYLDVSSL
jgi:predicted nuclease of predicted toxin-antitoxin system